MSYLLLFPIVAFCAFFMLLPNAKNSREKMGLAGIFCVGIIPLLIYIKSYMVNAENNIIAILINVIGLIVSFIGLYRVAKRNKTGNKELGSILGFKQFIKVAQAPRLKLLIKENPNYCFDVLPYAYTLEVYADWIRKFQNIINYNPSWYSGDFSESAFNKFLEELKNTTVPTVLNGGISEARTSS